MAEFDCMKCLTEKYWKSGCVGKEWYEPREIFYCKAQMVWLIEHLKEMIVGDWSDNPAESRAEMPENRRVLLARAYFEPACAIAGDVESRLNETDEDGKTLVHEISQGLGQITLNKRGGQEARGLALAARRVLNYIMGWKTKRMGYKRWVSQRRYRSNETILSR